MLTASGARTARFAAWVTALLAGRISPGAAVDGVVGEDAFHEVAHLPGRPEPLPLAEALEVITTLGATGVRYAPAAPGRVGALPGPSSFNRSAVAAGGAAVSLAGPPLGWLPTLTRHGPAGDAVTSVTWQTYAVSSHLWAPTHLGSAARLLVAAFQEALDELHRLDVARARPGVRELVSARRSAAASHVLPPGHPPSAADLLDRTVQLQQVVALAQEDDGGTVTGAERGRRAEVLRALEVQLEEAGAAAWNAGLPAPDPPRRG
ncbi:MAG: hypothetical protein OEV62_09340 [Actinomycetota bacterium]|nr:hypothetical protein [Actinomycetota bacterium]